MSAADDFPNGSASEQDVAETIVNARKSWKTVKGKSEAVWPPQLEKALVKGQLAACLSRRRVHSAARRAFTF